MPWFWKSSRKKAKAKVGGVRDDTIIGYNKPSLGILLQNFTATTQDELNVVRGQVIELFDSDGTWRYVRDVDGKCGYVPNAFCYPLDRIVSRGAGQWKGDENENEVLRYPKYQSRPRTLHLDGLLPQGASESPEGRDEHPTTNTSNASREAAEGVRQATPPGGSTPLERAACTPAQETEIVQWRENVAASSQQSSYSSNSSPQYTSTPRVRVVRGGSVNSVSETDGDCSHGPVPSQDNDSVHLPCHRTSTPITREDTPELPTPYSVTPQPMSCISDSDTESNQTFCQGHTTARMETTSQEDALDAEEAMDEVSELRTIPDHCQPVLASASIPITVIAASPVYDRLESIYPTPVEVGANVPEDLFSNVKKPQGIYRCIETYEAQFEGQVSLRQNELVVVLEFGRGEWAWVFTSTSAEGLVPKSLLKKHQPGLWMAAESRADQLSTGTQTELIVSGSVRQVRVKSSSSASRTSDKAVRSSSSRSSSRASSRSYIGAGNGEVASVGVQTEFVSPEWFKNNASPCHEENAQRLQTPPRLDLRLQSRRLNSTLPNSPSSVASSPMPVSRSKLRFVSLNALGDHRSFSQRHRRLARSESEPVCDNTCAQSPLTATSLVQKLQSQTPIFTAIRDYQPPANGKNCLVLQKGDILYQQSNVPYPNGWMWVYHSVHRSFGYVPKSHVARMYIVQKKPRTHGQPPVEVEV